MIDEQHEDFEEFSEEQLELLKRMLEEQQKLERREKFWFGEEDGEEGEGESSEDEQGTKNKKEKRVRENGNDWQARYQERVGQIERRTGDVSWVFLHSSEIIEGYLEERKLFEIKRGFSMYNLTIVDKPFKEHYEAQTSFRSHSASEYQKLKEKALKIREKYLEDE